MNPVSHKEAGFLFVWGCQVGDNAENRPLTADDMICYIGWIVDAA